MRGIGKSDSVQESVEQSFGRQFLLGFSALGFLLALWRVFRNRLDQFCPVVLGIPYLVAYAPGFEILFWVWAKEIEGQTMDLPRLQPSLVVLRFDDDAHSVVVLREGDADSSYLEMSGSLHIERCALLPGYRQ